METIFKEEELRKYIDSHYDLYCSGENITIKEAFEMGFRAGIVKALNKEINHEQQ